MDHGTCSSTTVQGGELAPVDSNHHTQIQSLVSCHWTRGQRDGKNLHYDPVRRRGAACCAPTRCVGSGVLAEPDLPKGRRCGRTTVARTEQELYGSAEHHPRRWGRESTRRPQAKRCSRSPRRVSAKPPRVG